MVDISELVRTVVREVMERMDEKGAKPCVMVLAVRDAALLERVEPLIAPFYAERADILFMGEDSAGRVPARYILPVLSCSDMADLAAGRASSPCMEEVLALLLRGREVEVLEFAYRSFADSAPGPLCDLYAGYEKVLAGYGVKAFRPRTPDSVRVRENLITAAVVEQAGAEGIRSLVVPVTANVTPLAAETAEALHMSILKQL